MAAFLSSLADKAQSAINASPLAGHIPSSLHGLTGTEHPTANEAAAQGGLGAKSHTLGNIQHQLRSLQFQYSSASPVQRIITAQKGVALDFNGTARDVKRQSRELFMWGQNERDDLKDVSDRLAYLNFVQGALTETLANELDTSRSHLKALRDAENKLTPRRNIRAGIQNQIARIEHDQQKGMEGRIAELKQHLQRAEREDEPAEKEFELLKRKALKEGEEQKWKALSEYGGKLVLLAEASTSILSVLPSVPPSTAQPYTGSQTTAATRASLQRALDDYKPGNISHSFQPSTADLNRSDSRSFGITHARELSSIASTAEVGGKTTLAGTPPPQHPDYPALSSTASQAQAVFPNSDSNDSTHSAASAPSPDSQSSPINPLALNNSPSLVPKHSSSHTSSIATPASQSSPLIVPDITTTSNLPEGGPTVAETGVPLSAGANGPGPASGSIHNLRAGSPHKSATGSPPYGSIQQAPGFGVSSGQPGAAKFESAEEEKKRLQREDRERLLRGAAPPSSYNPPAGSGIKYESAEEAKKRLEREEVLRVGSTNPENAADGDGSKPPPYQDF